MATVFHKEVMAWLSGRFLKVSAWRQFFNLAATIFGGERWSLIAYVLPCIVPTVWDLLGPYYNSSSTEDDAVPLLLEARDIEWEQSVSSDTFLGCDQVVGAGTATCYCTWALDVEIPPFGDLALAGPALLLLALPPFFGWVSLGPVRACVCVCVWVGACWGAGSRWVCFVGWNLDSFLSPCLLSKKPYSDIYIVCAS